MHSQDVFPRGLLSGAGRARVCLLGLLLGALAGCGGHGSSSSSTTNSTLSSITVSPSSPSVSVNGTQSFTATATDSSGKTMTGLTFTWASSQASVATIDSSGVATGHAVGTAQITATSSGVTSSPATLTVVSSPVASVSLSPTSVTLSVGGTQQLTASATNPGGSAVSGATFTWRNSNAGVVLVSGTGLVTALSPGTALVTASIGNVTSPVATINVQ